MTVCVVGTGMFLFQLELMNRKSLHESLIIGQYKLNSIYYIKYESFPFVYFQTIDE